MIIAYIQCQICSTLYPLINNNCFAILIYSTKREWLKDKKYQSQASIDKLHHDKELSDEHYKMLSGFLRHVDFVSDRPSEQDVKKVVNAYTEGV